MIAYNKHFQVSRMEKENREQLDATPSTSGATNVRRGARLKKDKQFYSPELIGPKNPKEPMKVVKKKAGQSDKLSAAQKKNNELKGDLFFLNKYSEAEAACSQQSVQETAPPTISDELAQNMLEKMSSLENRLIALEEKVDQSSNKIIEAFLSNNSKQETHTVIFLFKYCKDISFHN
ncbi:uncharacterized protein LOC127290877 [Leptopilina boulardi]|uniref:uncharacterized protein LOC127290877 n=1 Tax=Leptopilina boulardi TaxID=63433 RepID=UPI0021F51E5C|nr:uncharacterized protein LOC127290877 [Leptopilina boulardi]